MHLAADLVSEGRLEVHQTDPVEIELDVLSRMIDAVRARDFQVVQAVVIVFAGYGVAALTRGRRSATC